MRILFICLVALSMITFADQEYEDFPARLKIEYVSGDVIAVVCLENSGDDVYHFSKHEVGLMGFSLLDVFLVTDVESGERVFSSSPVFDWGGSREFGELSPGDVYSVKFNLSKLYNLSKGNKYRVKYNVQNHMSDPWTLVESEEVEVDASKFIPDPW